MRIALWGATGTIGQRILREALDRGHAVRAVVRDPARVTIQHPKLEVVQGDALDPQSVAQAVRGCEVVVSALGPSRGEPPETLLTLNQRLVEGVRAAGVRRLIAVGGAGSLEVAPGQRLLDTPDFPPGWKAIAEAAAETLAWYRREANDLEWTVMSPAAFIQPGSRTGRYRTGTDQLVTDERGESRISAEDFAVALVDEVEQGRFIRRRFTVAY
ncbi:MAG: NAD(P)-dependent oxidoreductase [Firmicutes bacterium]|nr:NAD(P)-dependent oxidoreductase [Alicyclobacillaceae bacterium]MCL6497388.1 NAD(P)-dependent oxidoreductase [Bacillota bacterium]